MDFMLAKNNEKNHNSELKTHKKSFQTTANIILCGFKDERTMQHFYNLRNYKLFMILAFLKNKDM